jgi:hypothetical protein
MQYPGYNSRNIILIEGEWFPFRIHNIVQLQDNEWYYVLLDINGLKHFIPAEYYKNYGFKIGDEITCKIDRINCTGRLFLEPKHPYYNEGEIYTFEVISILNIGDEGMLIVKEFFGNCIEVPLCGNKNIDVNAEKSARCIVRNIKKGKPILEIC